MNFDINFGYSQKQWLTILVFAIVDFCSAICVSLWATFYPHEAEKKGASHTEYGLIFGIFQLTVFIVSPIMGKYLNKFGAKRVFNLGTLTTGTCCILFGLLDQFQGRTAFIAFSFLIRSLEAVGNSGFLTSSFSIIAKEFPENVGTMFAGLQSFFRLGLIVGPTIGAALYQQGGYILPFAVLGTVLVSSTVLTYFVLPDKYNESNVQTGREKGLIDLLKVPSIAISAISVFGASLTIGFIQA